MNATYHARAIEDVEHGPPDGVLIDHDAAVLDAEHVLHHGHAGLVVHARAEAHALLRQSHALAGHLRHGGRLADPRATKEPATNENTGEVSKPGR